MSPLTLEETHEIDYLEAVKAKAPAYVQAALEMRWRETMQGADAVLDFIVRSNKRYIRPDHMRRIAALFPRAERIPIRVVSSVPPRHSKTETLSYGLAWYLLRNPSKLCAYVSYSADIAESKSRNIRDIAIRSGLLMRDKQARVSEWRTRAGGGLLATGIGGPLTGYGIDGILVLDDAVKNREEAESPTVSRKNHEWFTSTAMTRMEPGSSVIVNMTRWSMTDIAGILLDDKETKWENINLPAIDDDGKPLWEERWPLDALEMRRREVGEYDWASMFMGQPRPKGGALFHAPSTYDMRELIELLRGSTILVACDPAATAKTSADRSAIVVGAMKVGKDGLPTMLVVDVKTMQVELPALVRELIAVQKAWNAPIAVEAVAGFKAVPQMLKAIDRAIRVIPIHPVGDKFVRAQSAAAAWNDGRIMVPINAPWVEDFTGEVCRFTGVADMRDDQVDALAHCWNALKDMLAKRRRASDNLNNLAPMG